MNSILDKATKVVPSPRQLAWQRMEFYGFIHFGVNTYTDREWGDGSEEPIIFNPTDLDTDQWVKTLKSAGMSGVLITAKHHDGFCLWPSEYTEHSVKNSPWKDGKGDVVRELADSCRKYGLKLGMYLSPWDRHDERYGTDEYNTYFCNQLTELLTQYGDIFCVWFDGACGEGPNGKRQVYDWESYYAIIRKHQPNAVITICGPDVRWCGNEAGHCREQEWSVVPIELADKEKIAEESQKVDDGEFNTQFTSSDNDLGSREMIKDVKELIWYPAEVNTSNRHNWFYHSSDDDRVRSTEELFNIYCNSVGGNSTFLLNIPPTTEGLIHDNDVGILGELGNKIAELYKENIVMDAKITSNGEDEGHLVDQCDDTYFMGKDPENGETIITCKLDGKECFNVMILEEYIEKGQLVEEFVVEVKQGDTWETIYQGKTIGYRKICRFDAIKSCEIRVRITMSRAKVMLRSLKASSI